MCKLDFIHQLGLHETEVTRLNQKLKCLQSEVRELWYKCSEQEDRMNQAEKENQQLQHENNIYAEQVRPNQLIDGYPKCLLFQNY